MLDTSFFNNTEKKPGFTPRVFDLEVFQNDYNFATKEDVISFNELSLLNRIKKRFGLKYPVKYIENFSKYNPHLLSFKQDVCLQGYFQSYKYFVGNEDFVKSLFSFNVNSLSTSNKKLLKTIKETNSISIHIRRGDYFEDEITNAYHGVCNLDYYFEAINLLESRYDNLTLFFFSDDMDWVKKEFGNLKQQKFFIDNNVSKSWVDMFLMSSCKHNIIANSSFSWWGAWLNINSSKTVFAPKKWNHNKELDISSLLPVEWIKL
ncbi:alpha-1,2-fucosyltransferase [Seonamhaeicola sp. MEBiC1930]|uniref:alpha-1,2-fucosyltransferase n=1 Tax=Seonamhaeicola sp. MEBiC01930 TaxID=2976768 RepID=UPI00324E930C